ncbi:MAG: hypothetical protein CR974_03135 [Gammaproteobacteria bacterium]|nr:MAG: hypothetical protein CR974_03135 [Gammaproteobacteria bacterium]
MEITIISGGQTGVDRGALDGALAKQIPCAGWCPEGRLAEDGIIDDKYPLTVLPNSSYRARTRKNVEDSDATVIIYFGYIYLRGGTELTLATCIKQHRPYLLIDAEELSTTRAAQRLVQFIKDYDVKRLNFAGPRGSGVPKAHTYTQEAVEKMLDLLRNEKE